MESSQAADLNKETERFRNLTLDERLNIKIDKINREYRRGGTILIEPLYHLQAPEKRVKRRKKKKPSTDDGTEVDVQTKQSSHVPTVKTKKAHTSQDRERSRDKGSTKPDSGSSGEKATSSRKDQTNQNLGESSTKPNPRENDKSPRMKFRPPAETPSTADPSRTRAIKNNLKLLFNYKNKTIPKVRSGENTNQDGSNDNESSSEKKMVSPLEGLYPAERLQYGLHIERYSVEEIMGRPESHEDVNDNNTDPEQQKNWDFLNKTTKIDEMYKNLTMESKKDELAAEARKKEKSKTNDKNKTKNAKKQLTRPKEPPTKNTNKETVNNESERAPVTPKPSVSEDRNESLILEENAACPMKIIEVKSISKLMTVAAQKAWNSLKGKKKVGELRRDRKRDTTASKSLSSESKKRNNNDDRKKSHRSKSKTSKNRTTTKTNTDQAPESELVNDENQTLTMGFNAEVNNNSPQPLTSQEETIPDYYDWMNPNYTNDGNMEENRQTLTSVMNIDDDSINDIHATRIGSRDSISTIEIDNSSNSFNAITMNLRTGEPTELVENVNDNGIYSAFDERAGHLFQGEDGQGDEDRLFGDEDGCGYYEDEGYNMQMLFGEEDGPKLFAEGQDLFEVEDGPKLFGETGGLIEDEDGPKFFPGPDLFEEEDGPKISAVIGNVIEGAFGTEFYEGAGNLNEAGNDREFREGAENSNEYNDNEEIFSPDEEEEPESAENPNRRLNTMKKKKKKKNTEKKKTEKNKKKKKKLGPAKKKGLKRKGQAKNRVKRKRTAKAKPPIVRIYQTRNRLRMERGLTNLIDLFDEIENELEENVGDTSGAVGEGSRPKPKREVQKLREGLYNAFKKRPNNQQSRSPSPDPETESHASDSPRRSDRKRSRSPQGDNQDLDIERKRAKTSSDETDNLTSESQESNNEQTSVEADSSPSERHEEEPATDDTSSSERSMSDNQDSYVEEGRAHKTPYNLRTFTVAYQKKARKTPYNLRSFTKAYQMRVRKTSYDFRNVLRKYNFLNRTTKRHAARDSGRGYQDSENGDSRTEGESESRDLDSNGELDEQERAGTEPENEEQDLGAEREPSNIPHESNVEKERVFTEPENIPHESSVEEERVSTEPENIPHESNVEEERVSTETDNIPHESNVEEERVSTETDNIPLESNVEEERVSTESENENQDLDVRQEQVEREFENKKHAPNAVKKRAATGSENEEQNLDTKERTTETVRSTLSVATTSNIGKKRTQNKAGKKMTGPHKRRRIISVEDANITQSLNLNPRVVLDKLNLKTFDHDEIMSVARDIQSRQRNLMQSKQQAKGHKRSQPIKEKKTGGRFASEHPLDPNQGGVSNEKQSEVQKGEDQDKEQDKKAGSVKRMKSFLERNVRKSKRMKFRGSGRGYVGKKLTEACFRAFLPPNSSTAHRKRKSDEEMREEHLNNKKKRVPVRNETATDSESIQWLKSYSLLNYSFQKSQRLYRCMLCPKSSTFITSHYKLIHQESEVLISRLNRKEASDAIADAIAEGIAHEVENKSTQARPQSCVYICRMCDKGRMTTLRDFFEHVTTHTGEYNSTYPTSSSTSTFRRSRFPTGNTLNSSEPLYGFICSRCNYVQVFRKNVQDHVERKHKEDRNIPIIKINLSSKVPSEETNEVEKNPSTTSGKKIMVEKEQQTEDDAAEVENDDAEVENDDAEVENDDAEVENDDAEVENDDAEVENDDAEVEDDDAEVEDDDAEVENDDAEVENDDAEVENYAAAVENYAAGVEYYAPSIVFYTAGYCGAEAENYVAEVENYAAVAENYVAEVENGGAEAENYDEEVQNGERVEEESYTPKSPSPEPNRETFGLETNEERAKPNDEPELINIADLPNSPPLVELDVDEEPKLDDVEIKVEYEIQRYPRKWVVGLLKAQILDDSDFLYDCLVKTCMFTTRVYSNFESHVRIMHSNTSWRGNCDACDHKAKPGETLTMLNALEHLTSHSRARRSRNKSPKNDIEIVTLEQQPVEDDSNNNTAQNHKASCYYAHECGSELCRHCIRGFCDERCFVIRQPPHGVKTYFCNFCTFKSALKKSMAKHVFSKHSTMMENALLEKKVTPNLDPSSSASNPVDNYQYPLYSKPDQDQPVLQQYTINPPQTTTLNIVEHDMTHDLIPVIPPINFSEPIITQPIDSYPDNEPLDLSQDARQSRERVSYPASRDRNFLGEWEPRTEEE